MILSPTQIPTANRELKVALALHSTQAMSELRGLLSDLGIAVVAQGHAMGCLQCDHSQCQAQLVIADPESLASEPLLNSIAGCEGKLGPSACDPTQDESTQTIPIILIGDSPERSPIAGNLRIMGYLKHPFSTHDLSNVIDVVLRNQSEFHRLQQQCGIFRSLLQRLKQKMSTGRESTMEGERVKPTSHQGTETVQLAPVCVAEAGELQSLETIPHAIQEVDPSGKLIFSNPAHCHMHGYDPGELVGKMIWELLATELEQQAFRRALEERLRYAPPPVSYQTRHRRRDGRIIDVQVDWTYKRDRMGAVEGYISIITDISQQLRDRRELRWLGKR